MTSGTPPLPDTEPGSARLAAAGPAAAVPRAVLAAVALAVGGAGRLPGWVTARAGAWQAQVRGAAAARPGGRAGHRARAGPRAAQPAVAAAVPVPDAPGVAGDAAGRRAVPAAGAAPGLAGARADRLRGILRNLYDALQFGYAPLPLAPAIAFATVADRSRPLAALVTLSPSRSWRSPGRRRSPGTTSRTTRSCSRSSSARRGRWAR